MARAEWFRSWFGEEYLRLYPHRDEAEAAAAVSLFLDRAGPLRGPVLDLACGSGRHLRELRRAGLDAVGLDLSMPLLSRARASGERFLLRGDMRRLPFRDATFAAVTSFFTSFGYFAARADDRRVAVEMRRVLRTGGSYLLDYLNAPRVRETLVPEDIGELDGRAVVQTRAIENGFVVKRIRLEDPDGESRLYEERVRLYEPDELADLLRDAGLTTDERLGDYEGASFEVESPRLIFFGRAA